MPGSNTRIRLGWPSVALVFLVGGCLEEPSVADPCEVRVSLVEPRDWSLVPYQDDPLASHEAEPDVVVCGPDATGFEWFGGVPSWSIDTKFCGWATLRQASLSEVQEGELITVRVWHAEQAPSGATGEAHVIVGSVDTLWEAAVTLPIGQGGLLSGSFPAPAPIAEGAPLYWHVDNHGYNTWNLLELSVVRSEECATQ